MRIRYDREVDALYIELLSLAPGTAENRELTEDIIADYSPDGKLAGLEILDASQAKIAPPNGIRGYTNKVRLRGLKISLII